MKIGKPRKILLALIFLVCGIFFISSFVFSSETHYGGNKDGAVLVQEEKKKETKHIKTPEPLKSVYMSACYASAPSLRAKLVGLVDETELNSIVIDIKDYTGTVSFKTGNENIDLLSNTGTGCKVRDMKEFVESLHDKDIYVIGRVTVFQDPLYTKLHPEVAVKRKDNGEVWRDRKGLAFIDVGARSYWDHVVAIATSSYALGFDEINFDYIRYPSDGDMTNTNYTHSGTTTKRETLRQFWEYLDREVKSDSDGKIVTSADVFGMTTTNTDDLNIGQILEYALLNFDYVAPMVYPSHYPANFNGWKDPNKVPYDIIKFTMGQAVVRTNFLKDEIASTSPKSPLLKRLGVVQLRPWLQDFDYPVPYTPEMVRTQIEATYDVGLSSWMLWDPANIYTKEALLK